MKLLTHALTTVAILAVALGAGCITTGGGIRIHVDNLGQEPMRSVTVHATDAKVFRFETVPAGRESETRSVTGELPAELELRWTNARGDVRRAPVALGAPIPDGFKGRIVVQMGSDSSIKGFVLPSSKGGTELPWNVPPSWQGVTSIPGLDGGGE